MVGFLQGRGLRIENSPVSRVRSHLMRVWGSSETPRENGSIGGDLTRLLIRLRRLQDRGGAFRKVELSSHVEAVIKTLRVVGDEMLVLVPERGRA